MAGAKLRGEILILGRVGKKAACGVNTVVADNYGAVVQRGFILEKIAEKLRIGVGVDHMGLFGYISQLCLAFDYD